MKNHRGRVGIVPASFLAVTLLSACSGNKDSATPPSGGSPVTSGGAPSPTNTGVSVGQPGGEVEAVKAMLTKMSESKDLKDIGPYLSNRTAAAFGLVLMIPLGMVIAFSEMGQGMAQGLGKALGGNDAKATPPPPPDKNLTELKADLDALGKKYGMDNKKNDPEDAKKIEAKGREFFGDVAGLFAKLEKSEVGKGKMDSPKTKDLVKDINDVELTVVSPTEVKITSKTKKDEPARAIVEDGAWRLDMGGMDEFAKHMGGSKGTPAPVPIPVGGAGTAPGPGKPSTGKP
jgi:hypothetical protein